MSDMAAVVEAAAEAIRDLWDSGEPVTPEMEARAVIAALTAAGFGLVADDKRRMELAALLAYEAVEVSAIEQAKAEAWDEGCEEATDHYAAHAYDPNGNGPADPPRNPYRKASNDQ